MLLLPSMEMATTQQVANFYNVGTNAIRLMVVDHRDEFISDGYCSLSGKAMKEKLGNVFETPPKISNFRGGFSLEVDDVKYKFNNAGTGLFPKRAILRVGMLLRDSAVAKEVRTQLLREAVYNCF